MTIRDELSNIIYEKNVVIIVWHQDITKLLADSRGDIEVDQENLEDPKIP